MSAQLPKISPFAFVNRRTRYDVVCSRLRFDYAAYAANSCIEIEVRPSSLPPWPPLDLPNSTPSINTTKKENPTSLVQIFQGTRMQNKPLEYIRLAHTCQLKFYCQSAIETLLARIENLKFKFEKKNVCLTRTIVVQFDWMLPSLSFKFEIQRISIPTFSLVERGPV